mgnify:CR=1 FL=1
MGQSEIKLVGQGRTDGLLSEREVQAVVFEALEQADLANKRVLILIPDSTRTMPLGLFFRLFHQ